MGTVTAYLGLGSNIGDRAGHIRRALALLGECGVAVRRQAAVYRTAPWGRTDQDYFFNTAVAVETGTSADELLGIIGLVERRFAVRNDGRWGPREVDIDILLFGGLVRNDAGLTVPHPRMQDRRFVLVPLAEIAGDVVHPVFNRTISQLLEDTADTGTVVPAAGRSVHAVHCH